MEKEIKSGVKASRKVKTLIKILLLPTLNFLIGPWPISLSHSSVELARELT